MLAKTETGYLFYPEAMYVARSTGAAQADIYLGWWNTPVELGNITLAKGVCIQLAFKNTKATFYRQVSSPNTIAAS